MFYYIYYSYLYIEKHRIHFICSVISKIQTIHRDIIYINLLISVPFVVQTALR